MVFIVNAVNFMDGINGITSVVMAVWGVTALAVAADSGVESLQVIGGVTLGAALGFLPWNALRPRLFLGDVGSYLLGGLVGAGLIVGWLEGASVAVLAAPLAPYAADTGWALVRRARRGSPLMVAHREHAYQRLVHEAELSHVTVCLLVLAFSVAVTITCLVLPLPFSLLSTATMLGLYLVLPTVLAPARKAPSPELSQRGSRR
jgi:UDP-N-acetylmuramyl pentapeptide phosphotransferase/UDP-N-acetylglucosamine-1-phosphate transferase